MTDKNNVRVGEGSEQTPPKPHDCNDMAAQTSIENNASSASPVDPRQSAADQRCGMSMMQDPQSLDAPVTRGYTEPMNNRIQMCNRFTPCKWVEPDVMTIEGHHFGIAEKHGTPRHIIDEFWDLFDRDKIPRYKDIPPHLLAYENPALLEPVDLTDCYYQAYGRLGPFCEGCGFPCGRRVEEEGGSMDKGCPTDGACEGNTYSGINLPWPQAAQPVAREAPKDNESLHKNASV